MTSFLDSSAYTWIVLPLLIFFARILDVSLDTVRIIFINKNLRYYAAFIGFFAVLIWLLVIRQVFQQLNNPLCFVAYAAGYATGNYLGIIIENKMSIGKVIVRIMTRLHADDLIALLRSSGYGITVLDGTGATGPVKVIFTIVERSDVKRVVELIREHNPLAFYSVEDVRTVSESVTPFRQPAARAWNRFSFRPRRKER